MRCGRCPRATRVKRKRSRGGGCPGDPPPTLNRSRPYPAASRPITATSRRDVTRNANRTRTAAEHVPSPRARQSNYNHHYCCRTRRPGEPIPRASGRRSPALTDYKVRPVHRHCRDDVIRTRTGMYNTRAEKSRA